MSTEEVDTLVVGAGQAGVAMSEHLSKSGVHHVVLERHRIAERWRTERWDSLVANGPAWHDRFPGLEFSNVGPDEFATKEEVAAYFEQYATKFNAPIRCGIEVSKVERNSGKPGFTVETNAGTFIAQNIVAATGPFQVPVFPSIIPESADVTQMHSSAYRNPAQIKGEGILVVGAGSSGVQIAEELMRAGKEVYLSVGPHERPPRAYRGRDFCWWLGVLGKWDAETRAAGREHVTIAVSGSNGGYTIDFRRLASRGMKLVGLTKSFESGKVTFAEDLARNLVSGDESYLSLLDEADAYVAKNGIDLPLEPEARVMLPDPDCVKNPILELDLAANDISSVIWATGFAADYSWLKVDTFDQLGRPKHHRGVSEEPGIYFLGLPWQSRRGSSFIWGVWHDAKHLADRISTQKKYLEYRPSADLAVAPAQLASLAE